MHEKPSLIMLLSAKQETSHLLGADAEERQARQLIMHRNQEQYRNSLSKRKRNDPERQSCIKTVAHTSRRLYTWGMSLSVVQIVP